MKIIILNISPYKDNDAIISAFNDDGSYDFIARGILNSKNKLAMLNNPLTYAEVEISKSKKSQYESIKNANVIFSCMELMSNFNDLMWCSILADVIKKCLNQDERPLIFKPLLITLGALKANFNKKIYILSLLGLILKLSGFEMNISECNICHNKDNITNFSLKRGGFICKNDNIDNKNLSREQLILYRDIFKGFVYYGKEKYQITNDDFKKISKDILNFIADALDFEIKNITLLYD